MPKVFSKLRVIVLDTKGNVLSDEHLSEKDAFDRFEFYIRCHIEIGFNEARIFRLVGGSHILFEFRDVRRMVKQSLFDDYLIDYLY